MKFGIIVGVGGPIKPADSDDWLPGSHEQYLANVIEQARLADRMGFDYLWATEHHFSPDYSHFADPTLVLAAIAQVTRDIRVGTGIMQMSHRHPLLTAEAIATVDLLSGGRFEFGVGTGHPAEYTPIIGAAEAARGASRRREAMRLTARVLAEQGGFTGFRGEHFDVPPVHVVPHAVQRPHPPMWLAGTRPETIPEAAAAGMGSLVLSFAGAAQLEQQVNSYWEALLTECSPMGAAVNPAIASFSTGLVAESDELAVRRSADGLGYAGYAGVHRDARYIGVENVNIYRDYLRAKNGPADDPKTAFLHQFAASPAHLVGSIETVREKVARIEATHVDALVLNMHAGPISHEHVLESIELFGRHIIPDVAARHEEHRRWRAQHLAGFDLPISTSI